MKATPPPQSWQPWAISPLSPGRRIGAYRIEALLARGGMAYVYQAVHVMLGRAVAIKILPAVAAADTDARTRFGYEARSVASLRHPHILEIFDAGEVDDLPYLVTELVTGGTLADQLREHRAPVERLRLALTTARAIGSALDYAHRQGVLHRDVKPSNILLTGTGRLILADFGLAQVREATIRVTQPGDFWGSLDYSSPEQLQGEAVCSRSDLYSLGVVLYEILAGRVPFATDTPMATALAHLHQPPPAVHDLAPGLPPSTDDVLAKGLAKSPQDRYGTGAALTAAVAGVAAEGGATDAPPAWSQPTPPPAAPVPLPVPLDENADSTTAPARTPPRKASALAAVTLVPATAQPQRHARWSAAAATALLRLAATPLLRLTTAALSVVAVVLLAVQLASAWLFVGVVNPAAPRVTEASPPDGARGVTTRPELELRFSAPMDAASVEAALAFDPPIPASYEWQNNATRLLIVPVGPLAPETEYVLNLGPGARDRHGAALAGAPLERRFVTEAPRTMLVNISSEETRPGGGASGMAYPMITPDIQQVSIIELATSTAEADPPPDSSSGSPTPPPVATPVPTPAGSANTEGLSPTTPPPLPLPHAE